MLFENKRNVEFGKELFDKYFVYVYLYCFFGRSK